MPISNAPDRMLMPPISRGLFSKLEVEAPVLVVLLLPEFVPFVAGAWLLAAVGDALAVGDAGVAVALAFVAGVAVGVFMGVGVAPDVIVGEGPGEGDGCGVGEGGTTGAE
jgi:hypothetical protein